MGRFEDIAKTLNVYFNGFCPAYLKNNIPKDAKRPYLTYDITDSNDFEDNIMQILLYDNSSSLKRVSDIVDKIRTSLDYGILVKGENLNIYLRQGSPFAQYIKDDNSELSVYINITTKIL